MRAFLDDFRQNPRVDTLRKQLDFPRCAAEIYELTNLFWGGYLRLRGDREIRETPKTGEVSLKKVKKAQLLVRRKVKETGSPFWKREEAKLLELMARIQISGPPVFKQQQQQQEQPLGDDFSSLPALGAKRTCPERFFLICGRLPVEVRMRISVLCEHHKMMPASAPDKVISLTESTRARKSLLRRVAIDDYFGVLF